MRVREDSIRSCAVFLGWPTEAGFLVEGTGFFVSIEKDDFVFAYVISAAHILWPTRRSGKEPNRKKIYIRINNDNGPPSVIETEVENWFFPEDKSVDLCAFEFDIQKHSPNDELDINRLDLATMVPSEEHLRQGAVGLGDEVVIIGAFVGRIGSKRNIPVARIGNISAMPEEPVDFGSPRRPAYLIETRSLGGISGSPILINLLHLVEYGDIIGRLNLNFKPPRADLQKTSPAPYNLVGMIIGAHGSNYFSDFVSESDTDLRAKDFEFNAGISVALPSYVILEFLNQQDITASREAAINLRKRRSGFRNT